MKTVETSTRASGERSPQQWKPGLAGWGSECRVTTSSMADDDAYFVRYFDHQNADEEEIACAGARADIITPRSFTSAFLVARGVRSWVVECVVTTGAAR